MATKPTTTKKPRRRAGTTPRPAAGRRERNKEATRQRIVAAALRLFGTKGFDATTTKEIAQRARVAEGTVFNYFNTKEDIALHFFEQEVEHAMAAVRKNARLRQAPLEEKLFALVQSQIEFLAPYERFIGAALVQALKPTSTLAFSVRALDLRNRYLTFVQDLIDESMPRKARTRSAGSPRRHSGSFTSACCSTGCTTRPTARRARSPFSIDRSSSARPCWRRVRSEWPPATAQRPAPSASRR